jgi:hypothetical protein
VPLHAGDNRKRHIESVSLIIRDDDCGVNEKIPSKTAHSPSVMNKSNGFSVLGRKGGSLLGGGLKQT